MTSEFWTRDIKMGNFKGQPAKILVIFLALIGILLILWPGFNRAPKTQVSTTAATNSDTIDASDYENELAGMLQEINGAGQVKVKVSLVSEGTRSYATNDHQETRKTTEKEQNGVTRQISEENVEHELVMANNAPVLVENKSPEITGVLVIAEGAGDSSVAEALTQAVTGLLGIPASRVTVLPMESGR
ncbi:MAG: hypothetical protein ACM3MK_01010 [Chitinophagales bacterium]